MTVYSSNAKRKMNAQRDASAKQQSMTESDSAAVQKVCDALVNIDTNAAQDIVIHPHSIAGLMSEAPNSPHKIKCPYALHAVLFPLSDINLQDILNQMSDERIDMLKNLITIAKKQKRPNKEIIKQQLAIRIKNAEPGRANTENHARILSLRVFEKVESIWDTTIQELDKWSKAIGTFERLPIIESTQLDMPEQKQMWTMDELFEKLGTKKKSIFYTNKHRILQRYSERAQEIAGWFVINGRSKLFDSAHFAEYKQMYDEKLPRGRKPGTKISKETGKVIREHPTDLLGIKALEKYITEHKKLCEDASEYLGRAEAECSRATSDVYNAKNARDRAEYLNRATKVNNDVVSAQEKFDNESNKLDTANKLWKNRQRAIEDLNRAQAALQAADEQIAKFLEQTNSISK